MACSGKCCGKWASTDLAEHAPHCMGKKIACVLENHTQYILEQLSRELRDLRAEVDGIRKELNNSGKELAKDCEVSLSKVLNDMFRAHASTEIFQLQEYKNSMQEQLNTACKDFDLKGGSVAKQIEESLFKALKEMSDQTSKEISELREECNANMQELLSNARKDMLTGDSATKELDASLSKVLNEIAHFREQTSKEMSELREECNANMQELLSNARKELDMLTGDSATKERDVSLSKALNEIAHFREQTSKEMSELRGDIAALSAERSYNKQYEIECALEGFVALNSTLEKKVRRFPEELAALFASAIAALDEEHEAVAVKHQHGELQLPVDGMPSNLETLHAPSQIGARAMRLAQELRQTLNERPEQVGAKTAGQSETQEALAPIMAELAKLSDAIAQLSERRQQFHVVIEHSSEGFKATAGKCERQT